MPLIDHDSGAVLEDGAIRIEIPQGIHVDHIVIEHDEISFYRGGVEVVLVQKPVGPGRGLHISFDDSIHIVRKEQ